MPKHPRYQDYVISNGKLVGEFEEMYRDFEDPWEQTTRERFRSEKAVALNLLQQLQEISGSKRILELGCGFGDFAARATSLGLESTGLDISQTAIAKARKRHPGTEFIVGSIADHEVIKRLAPNVIVMAEITWYVLEQLSDFIAFLKRDLPNVYLIHLLTTYAPGVQQYGKDYFTDIEGIRRYFDFDYLEWGLVQYGDVARTWFLGKPRSKTTTLQPITSTLGRSSR
jgi:SAM-dependent methyltransferase